MSTALPIEKRPSPAYAAIAAGQCESRRDVVARGLSLLAPLPRQAPAPLAYRPPIVSPSPQPPPAELPLPAPMDPGLIPRECVRCERVLPTRLFAKHSRRCRLCEAAVRSHRAGRLGHYQAARARVIGGDLTDAQWAEILLRFECRCAYCGRPWQVMDHRIPLSKGGKHTHDNVVPACSPCNATKGAATWEVKFAVYGH